MKKWTVMLIPHDRGATQTLNLSAYQLWFVVVVLTALTFTSAFFYGRHDSMMRQFDRLRQAKQDLELQFASQKAVVQQTAMSAQERAEVENRVRAEYEASLAAITAGLSDLYDVEAQARSLTGLAPRTDQKRPANLSLVGGKGGGGGNLGEIAFASSDDTIRPPQVIYGLSDPSADMVIQEINVRTESLQMLVADLKVREDQIARLPSILPTGSRRWQITSPYGYRKDPFTYRVGLHSGVDISAPPGSPVLAAARGEVVFAEYDGSYGRTIRINHGNGVETQYSHLQSIDVKVGTAVERRDVIGKLGSSGRSTGPHIHYEVHVNGRPVDPRKYFRD